MKIPFIRPDVPPPETWTPLLAASYEAVHFTNFGPLERRFAAACRDRYAHEGYEAVPVTNATAGLTAALMAIGGRRAIIPAFTFAATLHAVIQAGLEPVLCDADEDTWELSLDGVKTLLETQGADIIVQVRPFGLVRSQDTLLALADRYGAAVVIDGAAAFGHPGRAKAIGSPAGEVEVLSLHATKPFSIGEGGLVFAPAALAGRIRATTNFGLDAERRFGDGGNMKLDEVRAAIGLAMLARIDSLVTARTAAAERWAAECGRTIADPGPTPWQCYPVLMPSAEARAGAEAAFEARGITTRRYYYPTLNSGYRGGALTLPGADGLAVAEALASRMLCLPILARMSPQEEAYLFANGAQILANIPPRAGLQTSCSAV